jgi:O-antigen/teichoic acid export membrane protein
VDGMFKFGLDIVFSNIVNYFARNADNIIIGKFYGANSLGLYSKSYQLFRLPTSNILSPIRNVALPVLSSIQNDEMQFVKYYKGIIALTATLIFPISVYFYFEADFIIPLILGNQWIEAIPIFKLLALGGMIQPITGQSGIVMIASGNSKRYLNWQIFYSICLVISFFIGIRFGVLGLAMAYAIAEFVLFIPGLMHNYNDTFIKPQNIISGLAFPFLICIVTTVIVFGLKEQFILEESILQHVLIALIFFTIYFLFTLLRKEMRQMIKSIISVLIKK